MKTIKTDLYVDGKYACSSMAYKTCREALEFYKKQMNIKIAGRELAGHVSDYFLLRGRQLKVKRAK